MTQDYIPAALIVRICATMRPLCTIDGVRHTALDMRRLIIYVFSAAAALGAYFLGDTAGLSNIVVLVLSFLGAIGGSLAGTYVTQRR